MEKLRLISLLWTLFLLNILKSIEAEEQNGYIFTCPRSLKTGATNQMTLRRFGNLDAGELKVKVTYTEGYQSNETTAVEKSFEIKEGDVDSVLKLYLDNFVDYVYSGKIIINGTFGDYVIGGSDKVQFNSAKDYIGLIQTDKPLYKEGQTVKFRVMRMNKELKPAVQDNADIWIEDPQGTRLFQWKDVALGKASPPIGCVRHYKFKKSERRGIQQFEFPLANEPVKGHWKVAAAFKGDIVTTNFEVKEYVLPKFEVKIQIPPFVLANAEEIPITICAKYTYGKNVKGKFNLAASLEQYSWATDKLPTLEHSGEIDGCIDYNINVSLVETEDFYRYRRIQIKAGVEEDGTGIQMNKTNYIQRQYTPLTLSFNREQRQFYKPGLPYNGKLFVKNPDNSEAAEEDIEICYTATKERVVMDGKWKATRTVKYCQNYTSDEDGEIQFVIPRQNTDSVEVNVGAKSLKYAKDKSKTGTPRQSSLSQPQTSMTLTPWYSPSGSFIQLQPLQETLLCGTTRKVKVLFTSKEDANIKFFYQVIHQGEIIQKGSLEKSFSVSDDVSSKYEEDSKVIDDSEVQIVPAIDSSQLPESTEEECKSAKEARYVPPVGEVDIEIDIDSSLSPSFHLLVYYIRDDKETIADSQKFDVEKCFKNQVKLQFGDDVKQPGTKTSIRVTSSPNSLCGIKVVDKSVTLLDSEDDLTAEKIFKILESFDGGLYYGVNHCNEEVRQPGLYKSSDMVMPQPWSSSSYEDSMTAFENAGFIVISNMVLFSRPCKSRGGGNIVYDEYAVDGQVVRGGAAVAMASVGRRPAASPPAAPAFSQKMGAEDATKSVVDVRNYFPDTWLFDLEMTGDDGVYITKEKLPHTITEWVGSAVCINDEDGLGISNTTNIKGFQAFFISTTVPYSVVRGEKVTIHTLIFSYVESALPVTVSVDPLEGFEVEGDGIDGDYCIQPGSSANLKLVLKATGLGKQNITIRAESAQSSDVCGSSEVSDALAKDAITSSLLVEPEGWPEEKVESVLFCPKDEENEVFKKTFTATLKDDVVPDSSRFYIDVSGSLLGKSMDNLENLVQLPTGCGEQNMVKFAPNVVVMNFLVDSKKLTPELEKRIIRNMNAGQPEVVLRTAGGPQVVLRTTVISWEGAQRQSKYRHSDGSYSAFGHRDKEGSMFLTAFVLRYFSQASKYITIDNTTIEQMQNWITSKQQADGCFPDVGKIIDRGIQGALKKDKSNGTITAYVLASLLTSGYENQTVTDQAFSCIKSDKDNTIYATLLYAYAEALAGKIEAANERINSVKDKSIKEGGTVYYHDVNATRSQDIETSAYFVLASLKSGSTASKVLPVVQYLMKNMNPFGGFISTQDTVVTLDALSHFALNTYKEPVDITVKATGALEKEVQITEDDKLISKRHKVENIPSEVNIEASGSGCAVIQSILRYNTKTAPESRNFGFDVAGKCLDENCKKGSISIAISYLPEDKKTGMTLIEVKLVSGWSPVKETLETLIGDKTLNLMRYDVENNVVVLYFLEITNKEKDFTFQVEKVVEVENSQPGTAKVYDYYDRDISSSTTYTLGNCKDSSSCPQEP